MIQYTRSYLHLQESGDGRAWGLRVFRGKAVGERLIKRCYKADWRLVPRDKEEEFIKAVVTDRQPNIVPDNIPFPPLMEYMIKVDAERNGQPLTEKPSLKPQFYRGIVSNAIYESESDLLNQESASNK